MQPLKLIALDEEDLAIVSSHLQDAVVRVGDMVYQPSRKRFAAVLNRFDWEIGARRQRQGLQAAADRARIRARFGARLRNVKPSAQERVLSLLAVRFEPDEAPAGKVILTFSGDASIQLKVECIEAELKDLGPAWSTRSKPEHPGNEPGS